MGNLLVEVIGSFNCVGYQGNIPGIVKQFAEETNSQICFKAYNIWNESSYSDMPGYILEKTKSVKSGDGANDGFFLNGSWMSMSPHNAHDATAARRKLEEIAGIRHEEINIYRNTYEIGKIDVHNCTVNNIISTDSHIKEFSTYTNEFDKVVFFDSKIKNMDISLCYVDKFTFNGYDVLKLIEIAKRNPELLGEAVVNGKSNGADRPGIDEIMIRLLTADELGSGFHPCCVAGFRVDPHNMLYQAILEKYGGWGYAAEYMSHPCGFLGIIPKDIAIKNVMEVPNHDDRVDPGDVLLITCLAGGNTYGSQYAGMGIAAKLVRQVIKDARDRGYKYIEGTQDYPGVHSILEKNGFTRRPWPVKGDASLSNRKVYYTMDL